MNVQSNQFSANAPIRSLLSGLALLAGGIFLLTNDAPSSLHLLVLVEAVALGISGLHAFGRLRVERSYRAAVAALMFYLALAAGFVLMSQLVVNMMHLILAVMFFCLFLLRALICVHIIMNGVPDLVRTLLSTIVSLLLAVIFGFSPAARKASFAVLVMGLYLVFSGASNLTEFAMTILGTDLVDERTRRRIYFTMPNFVTASMTIRFLETCGQYVQNHPDSLALVEEKEGTDQSKVNFEVLVHTSRKPGKFFGHVDVAIGDQVYTFGNYDTRSYRLHGFVADGIFAVLPREPYIDLCMTAQQKYITSFGCQLSESQLLAVRRRIEEIYGRTEPLELDVSQEDPRGGDGAISFARIGGDVRRVVRGNFRTYFLIASNCVKLADSIVGCAGLDAVPKSALVTPGAYLCLMENMFYRKNSRVIRRTTYLQPKRENPKDIV